MPQSRDMDSDDQARLRAQLDKFRVEFDCWRHTESNDWDLLDFVLYEGVSMPIVDETAPLILGEKCVALHRAHWCMLQSGKGWHFAIDHDAFKQPIDLSDFNRERNRWNLSKPWQRRLDLSRPAASPREHGKEYDLNVRETVGYMLLNTPDSFLRAVADLRQTPGAGRQIVRQTVDHLIDNLLFLSEARRDRRLDATRTAQHDKLMRRFRVVMDDLIEVQVIRIPFNLVRIQVA